MTPALASLEKMPAKDIVALLSAILDGTHVGLPVALDDALYPVTLAWRAHEAAIHTAVDPEAQRDRHRQLIADMRAEGYRSFAERTAFAMPGSPVLAGEL